MASLDRNTSLHCVNAVIYKASESEASSWEPLGEAAWTDMHILKDGNESNFRIVALERQNKMVILNARIVPGTIWNTANASEDTFAEFATTMHDHHYGLYFPDKAQRDQTTEVVEGCIAEVTASRAATTSLAVIGEDSETVLLGEGGGGNPLEKKSAKSKARNSRRISLAEFQEIHGKKPVARLHTTGGIGTAEDPSQNNRDTNVQVDSFQHITHVEYDEREARYIGLPEGWETNKQFEQFGIELKDLPKSSVEGYERRIPSVLVRMKRYLDENDAKNQVGIFRLAPDKEECSIIKEKINHGKFETCSDVNIVANLIKVWFREFPLGLYNSIPDAKIYQISDMAVDEVAAQYDEFKEPNKSLILWLLDMMAEYVLNEAVNKMSAKNMAIVMSPNLYTIEAIENPMAAMTMAQKISEFTTKMLAARLQEKYGYNAHIT